MKINAETIITSSKNYNFRDLIILINGNEDGLIAKIESVILKENWRILKIRVRLRDLQKSGLIPS